MMRPVGEFPYRLSWRTLPLLAAYAVGFVLLHRMAAAWGGSSSFSLWFPAAGLRFAMLWSKPFWFAPLVTLAELGAQSATGVLSGPRWWLTGIGIVSSSLGYGATIALVRWFLSARLTELSTPPMPVGIAMVLCPVIAVAGSMPWALLAAPTLPPGVPALTIRAALAEAGIYWLGDLLGILMIAPPLLWLRDRRIRLPRFVLSPRVWEAFIVVAIGWFLSALLSLFTGTPHVEPVLLGAIWVALRLGRMAGWVVGASATLAILLSVGPGMPLAQQTNLHLFAASLLMASYLVGSYAEAERATQRDLARTQRLLLRAERLKNLRAMSLAAIHDLSQPLSTLDLEARFIRQLAEDPAPDRTELIETSRLIERKTRHLTELVRRMRRFGSDESGEHAPVSVRALLEDVAALTRGEAEAAGAHLHLVDPEAAIVMGREVELQQALVNLVRNAIAAAGDGTVILTAEADDDMLRLQVIDNGRGPVSAAGMGLGLIVARTIAEAHGGRLQSEALVPSGSRYTLCLPRGEGQ